MIRSVAFIFEFPEISVLGDFLETFFTSGAHM